MVNIEKGFYEMKRKTPIKKAGLCGRPAGKELQRLSYLKPAQQSNLKFEIGTLLLFGDKQQKLFWPLLDVMLRQYFTVKQIEGKYEQPTGQY